MPTLVLSTVTALLMALMATVIKTLAVFFFFLFLCLRGCLTNSDWPGTRRATCLCLPVVYTTMTGSNNIFDMNKTFFSSLVMHGDIIFNTILVLGKERQQILKF